MIRQNFDVSYLRLLRLLRNK